MAAWEFCTCDDGYVDCHTCYGEGRLWVETTQERTCFECDGSTLVICDVCDGGAGWYNEAEEDDDEDY